MSEISPEHSVTTDRPGFDILTMMEEWRDWLGMWGGYENTPIPPALIAELTRQHAKRFEIELSHVDVVWHDLTGEFAMPSAIAEAVEAGFVHCPSTQEIDLMWADSFDRVADHLDLTVLMLTEKGLM
jgi:hypothetical protein